MAPSLRTAVTVLAVIAGLVLAWATLGTGSDRATPSRERIEERAAKGGEARVRGRAGAEKVMVGGEPRRVARSVDARILDGVAVTPWRGPDTPKGARTSVQDLRRSFRAGVQGLVVDLGLVGERAATVERLLLDAEGRLDTLRAELEAGSVPLDTMHERLVGERRALGDAVLQVLGREHAEAVHARLGGAR